jgi:hypothetical protein
VAPEEDGGKGEEVEDGVPTRRARVARVARAKADVEPDVAEGAEEEGGVEEDQGEEEREQEEAQAEGETRADALVEEERRAAARAKGRVVSGSP